MQLSRAQWTKRALFTTAAFVLSSLAVLGTASALCTTPPGDVNGNGKTNVSDVQCVYLTALYEIVIDNGGSATPPTCAFGGIERANLDCNSSVNVQDAQIAIHLALGSPLSPLIDSNANLCVDTCEAVSAVCGNAVVEFGEGCDDGFSNSDTLADFCRTDCSLPSCGDGVLDTGESCDDGNAASGDGCEPDCTLTGGSAFGLPYTQSFESGSFGSQALTVDDGGSGTGASWVLASTGPLGPDTHARFYYLPNVVNYQSRLVTPILDASTASFVTLQFSSAIALNGATATTTFEVLASSNGGDTWTTVWSRTGANGPLAAGQVTVDLSGVVANSSQARVAFRVAGPNSSQLVYWEIDTVQVRAGSPPQLATIAPVNVAEGGTLNVPVQATDLDTAGPGLAFSLVGAPAFVSITNNNDKTATLTFAPQAGQTGNYSFQVTVSDGTFSASRTVALSVASGVVGAANYILIRTAPLGAGVEAAALNLQYGQTVELYAAGYDATNAYVGDQLSTWTATGTLPAAPGAPATAIAYTAGNSNGSGTIQATPTAAGVTGDVTGTVTIAAPVGGTPNPNASTVDVSPPSIRANGTDTATVTVVVVDTNGTPVSGATVVIASNKGTLLGSVVDQGAGIYTRSIQADTSVGSANITATVNGQLINDNATLAFVNFFELAGNQTLNCAALATYVGANVRIASGTVEFDQSGGCAPLQLGDLVVANGAKLTHPKATATTEYRLDLQVDTLLVESGGQITVNGRGYQGAYGTSQPARTAGNVTEGAATTNEGGSHGGRGARLTGANASEAYDSFAYPIYPGAGGGYYGTSTSYFGGAGGGVIRIQASETVVVNGSIRADGEGRYNSPEFPSQNGYGSGGAGGSILIESPHVGGTGGFQANGGTSYYSGGGGGGRIALLNYNSLSGKMTPANFDGSIQARGGFGAANNAANSRQAGAGTVFFRGSGQTIGKLIIDNGGSYTTIEDSTPLLLPDEGAPTNLTSTVLTDLAQAWLPGQWRGVFLQPDSSETSAGDGMSGLTFAQIAGNDDTTITFVAPLSSVPSGALYRGVIVLDQLEVRGRADVIVNGDLWVQNGAVSSPDADTFRVGAALQANLLDIDDSDVFELSNGALQVNSLVAHDDAAHRLLYDIASSTLVATFPMMATDVYVNSSLVDVPLIDATGPMVVSGSSTQLTTDSIDALRFDQTGGTIQVGPIATSGRIAISALATVESMVAGDIINLSGAADVTVTGETVTGTNSVVLSNTAKLRHDATTPAMGANALHRLKITTNVLTVGTGTVIDLDGRGYVGGHNASGGLGYGRANSTANGTPVYRGASHGGLGGHPTTTFADSYGTPARPVWPGAGGGAYAPGHPTAYDGGAGGGVLRVEATSAVKIDGIVRANGSTSTYGGGGAGGSIWITTKVLTGVGTIHSSGGNGYTANNTYSGGGGGRIAIDGLTAVTGGFSGTALLDKVQAKGGTAWSTNTGGAGTIYVKYLSQVYGDLIIDNEGLTTPQWSTPIVLVPQGTTTSISGNTLTSAGAGWEAERYTGSWVNPDIAQGGSNPSLVGLDYFFIQSNDLFQLSLTGAKPLGQVVTGGETFRGILPLDHLTVRGNASFDVRGDLLVLNGNVASTDATTLTLSGTLRAQRVDFNQVELFEVQSGGGVEADVVVANGDANSTFDFTINNGYLNLPAVNAGTFVATNSNVTVGDLTISGDLELSGGTFVAEDLNVTGDATFSGANVTAKVLDSEGQVTIGGGTSNLDQINGSDGILLQGNANVIVHEEFVTTPSGMLELAGTAQLRHCETTLTKVCKLTVQAHRVVIASGAAIDASRRGYLGTYHSSLRTYSVGNDPTFGAQTYEGGSHGGMGGYQTTPDQVYGNPFRPTLPGGGGGVYANSSSPTHGGMPGGGVIRMIITDFLALDGAIRADGGGYADIGNPFIGSGGAGGSIWVTVKHLGGNGTIDVRGGYGHPSYTGAGGGGGRIAITGFDTATGGFFGPSIVDRIRVHGGPGVSNRYGGAGTAYVKSNSQAYGSLIINNGNQPVENDTIYNTPLPVVPEGLVTNVSGNVVQSSGAPWEAGAFQGWRVNPNIAQTGSLTGLETQSLFLIVSNTTDTLTLAGTPMADTVATSNDVLRGVWVLDNLEIRGKARATIDGDILVTKGDLASDNTTTLRLNGRLRVSQLDVSDVTQFVVDNGSLEADALFGGQSASPEADYDLTSSTVDLPSMSAGDLDMVSSIVTASSVEVTGSFTMSGASSKLTTDSFDVDGSGTVTGGTLALGDWTVAAAAVIANTTTTVDGALTAGSTLRFQGGTANIGSIAATGNLSFDTAAVVTIHQADVVTGGALRIEDSNTRLTHCSNSTSGPFCRLNIQADSLLIGAGASINVDSRGYRGGGYHTNSQTGFTAGNLAVGGAGLYVGGSHGGVGGYAGSETQAFGNFLRPTLPGGGGGYSSWSTDQNYSGGAGGGVVRLQIASTATIHGLVTANGGGTENYTVAPHSSYYGGGGAGGSIWLTAQNVGGNGSLRANGGSSHTSYSGGGGGGRIAITGHDSATGNFTPANVALNVRAFGGSGRNNGATLGQAGAGTLFVKTTSQSYGTLIIDNNDLNPNPGSTPVLVVDRGMVSDIDDATDSLLDASQDWPADQHIGQWVNPNLNQPNASNGVLAQTLFQITGHTDNTLNLVHSGVELEDIAGQSDTYGGVLVVDHLDVRRRARMRVGRFEASRCDLLVLNGNSSGTPGVLFVDGYISARHIDLNTLNVLDIDSGGVSADEIFTNGAPSQALELTLHDAGLDKAIINAAALTMTGTTALTADEVHVGGDASLGGTAMDVGILTIGGDLVLDNVRGTGGTSTPALIDSLEVGNVSVLGGKSEIGSMDATGAVTFQGGTHGVGTLVAGADVEVSAGGTLTINENTLTTSGQLRVVDSNSTLTHCNTMPNQPECKLQISADSLIVGAGALIDVSKRGYRGGGLVANITTGYTAGNTGNGGATLYEGGSHGGFGGRSGVTSDDVFGNYAAPIYSGGGGGYNSWTTDQNYNGGAGGGVIRIQLANAATINGGIYADGGGTENSGTYYGAGGAGGSIWLSSNFVGGTGTIRALGGSSHTSYSGGGGGGRIALTGHATSSGNFSGSALTTNVLAYGGIGYTTGGIQGAGGAGTIYTKLASQTYGSLIVDNNNRTTNRGSTPILLVEPATVSSIVAATDTLVAASASWTTNEHLNQWVNPNLSQAGAANGLVSQKLFRVSSHTGNSLALTNATTELESISGTGNSFAGVLALDQLDVRRGASMRAGRNQAEMVDIVVLSANLGPPSTTLNIGGEILAKKVDLNQTSAISMTGGGLLVDAMYRNQSAVSGFGWTGTNAIIEVPALYATSVNLSGASSRLVASSLAAAVSVLLDGTATQVGNITAGTTVTLNNLRSLSSASEPGQVGNITAQSLSVAGGKVTAAGADLSGQATVTGGTHVFTGDIDADLGISFTGGFTTAGRLLSGDGIELLAGSTVMLTNALVQAAGLVRLLDANTVLTHCDTLPGGPTCKLHIDANSLVVNAGAAVDVSKRGYRGAGQIANLNTGATQGNTSVNGAAVSWGGSHGGLSGFGVNASQAYGNFMAPIDPGAGGGYYQWNTDANYSGSAGGGVIRVTAATSCVINGNIFANGGGNNNGGAIYAGGGAGGSIWISAQSLAGMGSIAANGGDGHTSYSGGGGGGRIALTGHSAASGGFAPAQIPDTLRAYGGNGRANGSVSGAGGAGTIFVKSTSQTYGSLVVDNNNRNTNPDSTPVLVLPSGTATQVIAATDTLVDAGATWPASQYVGQRVNPDSSQPGAANGVFSLTTFTVTGHSGGNLSLYHPSIELESIAAQGDNYRGLLIVDTLDARRGAQMVVGRNSATRLDLGIASGSILGAANTWTLDGLVSAARIDLNTLAAIEVLSGGFSTNDLFVGGSNTAPIGLTITNGSIDKDIVNATNLTMQGSSKLQASSVSVSGDALLDGTWINAGDLTVGGLLTMQNVRAIDSASNPALLGHVVADDFEMIGGKAEIATVTSTGYATLSGAADLTISDTTLDVGTALALEDTSRLRHPAGTTTKTYKLDIAADTVAIGANASIDVTARGYTGSQAASSWQAYTNGNTSVGAAPHYTGGAHGGRPQPYQNNDQLLGTTPLAYGNMYAPSTPGGGGGYYSTSYPGNHGGGVVHIDAATAVSVQGSIRANGGSYTITTNYYGGGGAGGSIHIESPTITGAGSITANGGLGHTSYSTGGAGGRIALTDVDTLGGNFALNGIWNYVQARGDFGIYSRTSGAGTVYVKRTSQTYGDLIVANATNATNVVRESTPLRAIPEGLILSSTANTLTTATDSWTSDAYALTWLNPKVPQGTARLTDDSFFRVLTNTSSTLTVSGSMAALNLQPNGTYRGIVPLTNLEVFGNARMIMTNADLYVTSGDLHSNNTTTFELPGSAQITATTIDLGTATSTGSGTITGTLYQGP